MTRALLLLFVAAAGCGPPSATDPLTLGAGTLEPVHAYSALPRVTDENACVEELVVVVTNQELDCEAFAAQTEGIFLLEGEDRFELRLNRGRLEERSGTYEVLGGLLEPPPRQVFVSATVDGIEWRGFNGSAHVFSFDESGAAVSYSLELAERGGQERNQSIGGGILGEHCAALQDELTRCSS